MLRKFTPSFVVLCNWHAQGIQQVKRSYSFFLACNSLGIRSVISRGHVISQCFDLLLMKTMTDTKRFEGIDSEFKELMKEAINVPMAVDACGVEGRAEGLKSMMQRLEMCQKSLNEYLDMKKKVDPNLHVPSVRAAAYGGARQA